MAKTATLERPPAARSAAREAAPAPAATPAREPARTPVNPNVMTWTDANGKVWSRGIQSTSDNVLDFPPELIPDGMTYQWVRESIVGQPDGGNILSRGRKGWQAVPQDRHPDHLVAYDGLRLYEAPTVFVEMARKEEAALAHRAKTTATPGAALNLPSGFDGSHRAAQQNTFTRVGTPVPTDPDWRPAYRRDVDIDS